MAFTAAVILILCLLPTAFLTKCTEDDECHPATACCAGQCSGRKNCAGTCVRTSDCDEEKGETCQNSSCRITQTCNLDSDCYGNEVCDTRRGICVRSNKTADKEGTSNSVSFSSSTLGIIVMLVCLGFCFAICILVNCAKKSRRAERPQRGRTDASTSVAGESGDPSTVTPDAPPSYESLTFDRQAEPAPPTYDEAVRLSESQI